MSTSQYSSEHAQEHAQEQARELSQEHTQIIRKAISKPASDWDRAVKATYKAVAKSLADTQQYPPIDEFHQFRQNLNSALDPKLSTEVAEGIICYLAWQDKRIKPVSAAKLHSFRVVAFCVPSATALIAYAIFGNLWAVLLGIGAGVLLTGIWWSKLDK